mgnify:CR=1 FL=1
MRVRSLRYPAFSIVPANPKYPARVGDDAHIVPQSWMYDPPSQNGKCHRNGKNEPPGRRTSGSMRASTPTRRGTVSVLWGRHRFRACDTLRFQLGSVKPNNPTTCVGDDAYIVPQSGMYDPPSQNGKCHRYGKTNRPVDEPRLTPKGPAGFLQSIQKRTAGPWGLGVGSGGQSIVNSKI